jgi:hypothetical protein
MAVAPSNAAGREDEFSRSACTTSIPFSFEAWALGELMLRVMPRTFQPGSREKSSATAPP